MLKKCAILRLITWNNVIASANQNWKHSPWSLPLKQQSQNAS